MSEQHFQAVYEHGLLRPLEPVSLKEQEVVSLSIVGRSKTPEEVSVDAMKRQRQVEVVATFVQRMESLPDESPQDGLTNRDHDRLIYGS